MSSQTDGAKDKRGLSHNKELSVECGGNLTGKMQLRCNASLGDVEIQVGWEQCVSYDLNSRS